MTPSFEARDSSAAQPGGGVSPALHVANAPCSYGAFEITVGVDPDVPEPGDLLDHVAAAGYVGIDLGPLGYLGTGDDLRSALEQRRLALSGGYLELPFSEPASLQSALGSLHGLLDVFDIVSSENAPKPKPTLADAGSVERAALPGRSALDRSVGLDESGWRRFASGVAVAAACCRERGYEPTFHHHTATYIEALWEIERMLELTDVGLCLDTGHLLLGRGDPLVAIRDWGSRINHLHLKDARHDVLEGIVAEGAPVEEIWRRSAFCPLGTGDVDVPAVLAAMHDIGYEGWLVVEQDVVIGTTSAAQTISDQEDNRRYLSRHGI